MACLRYSEAESLLKESRLEELKIENHSNYGWLKSKYIQSQNDDGIEKYLEELKPMILKLSPEGCAVVAVKLDIITEESKSTAHIAATLKTLLQEQDSMQLLAGNVKRAKETKHRRVKVHPVLLAGRQPTVSFVVHNNKI